MVSFVTNTWFDRVHKLTTSFVRQQSVNGTSGEIAFATYLYKRLAAWPYFAEHPTNLRVAPAPDDPLGRSNVFALVRGNGATAVALAGHYDVVAIENYGALASYACDPAALLPRLIDELQHSQADALALADLTSGEWMPGRGALDMKSGLAAGVALLERFAEQIERGERPDGNLLLLATPDEEVTSHGMRAAAAQLPRLAREWGLDLVAAINLDSTTDRGDGRDGQTIFLGSVGKLLPSVYVAGRETHAGAPFDGVSASLLAAEITRAVEYSPELADLAGGETAPPPVCLKHGDLKPGYDVTTPAAAWCYYNQLTHHWPPDEVLARYLHLVQTAVNAALAHVHDRARRYAELAGAPLSLPDWRGQVLTFGELRRLALAQDSTIVEQELDALTARLADGPAIDLPHYCLKITELLWRHSGLSGPAAVVGFASLPYARVMLDESKPTHQRLRAVVERQAAALAAESGTAIRLRPFFPGISDMSFLGGVDTPADRAALAEQTPAWGTRIRDASSADERLDLPVVNIGPWGRDYHQRLERVYMPYSFGLLPELLWRIIGELFANR